MNLREKLIECFISVLSGVQIIAKGE